MLMIAILLEPFYVQLNKSSPNFIFEHSGQLYCVFCTDKFSSDKKKPRLRSYSWCSLNLDTQMNMVVGGYMVQIIMASFCLFVVSFQLFGLFNRVLELEMTVGWACFFQCKSFFPIIFCCLEIRIPFQCF